MKEKPIRKNPDMVSRQIGDETVLLPVTRQPGDENCIYTLNRDAAQVWKRINGKRTRSRLAVMLAGEFEGTEKEIAGRLDKLLDELRETKAVL